MEDRFQYRVERQVLLFVSKVNEMIMMNKNSTKTPLCNFSAEHKIVELLCNRPINIDLKDNQGVTALMVAAKNGIFLSRTNLP